MVAAGRPDANAGTSIGRSRGSPAGIRAKDFGGTEEEAKVSAQGSEGTHMKDYIIERLTRTGQALTVQNYFLANWGGCDGIESIKDLDAENLASIQRLVEHNVLVDRYTN
jgi:hypothetical protein